MGRYKIKYGAIMVLLVGMLVWSGCQSASGQYVDRQEFDALSRKVGAVVVKVNILAQASNLPSLASGPGAPKAGSNSVFDQAGLGGGRAQAPSRQAPSATGNEKALYQKGQSLLKKKKFSQAAAIFTQMLDQNPQGKLAPNARYWLGECHYASGRYAEAAREFQRCATDYPQSHKAPDSLLKLSYSYDRLGDGFQSMTVLDQLLNQYPTSRSAAMIKSGRGRFSP